MRKFARLCLTGVAIACSAMLLSGCAKPDPVVTPAPASSSKPLFASDADALAAATKAYAAYLKMSDLISQEGGLHPERLSPLVTGKWLKQERSSASEFAAAGRHQVGFTQFDEARLQSYSQGLGQKADVAIYLCLDLSDVRILDQANVDVSSQENRTRYSFVATFTAKKSATLLLDDNSPWNGKSFC